MSGARVPRADSLHSPAPIITTQIARTSAIRQDRDDPDEPDQRANSQKSPQHLWLDALTSNGGGEHSWHIDCEKCHLVAVAVHTGDARVGP